MNRSDELTQLRQQMAQIIADNPAPATSLFDRNIALFEDDLREAGVQVDVQIAFGELSQELATFVFNSDHGFIGSDYYLLWGKFSKSNLWSLGVLNQKSGAKKRLLDCPEVMKDQLSRYLDIFATKIASQMAEKAE